MAISPRPDACAVVVRDHWGRYDDNCPQQPTHRAVWRFTDDTARILLCDQHASEYGGQCRLVDVGRIAAG